MITPVTTMLRSLLVIVAMLAVAPSLAAADTSYESVGSFGTTQGSGDGETSNPQHVAVQAVTGNIFVADRDNNRVQVFAPDGFGSATYLTQFGSGIVEGPAGIAVDQSNGDVYVSDADDVVKFSSDGALTPTFTQDGGFTSPGVTGPLGYDQSADQLLVADTSANVVRRYTAGGAVVSSFGGAASGAAFSALKDIAVQDDGDALIVDAARVVRFDDDDNFAATLSGLPGPASVVAAIPGSDNVVVGQAGGYLPDFSAMLPSARLHRFTGDTYNATTVLPDAIQGLFGLAVAGDFAGNLYAASGPGNFVGGDPGVRVLAPFDVQSPIVTGLGANPSEFGAQLSADVNPNRDDTTYQFEYGPTSSYGKVYPLTPVKLAAGASPVAGARTIGGLQPGTEYHFRLVATNGGGTTTSPDQTFTTKTPVAPGPGGSSARSYEQVSPADKNGLDVTPQLVSLASSDGSTLLFGSSGVFPEAQTGAGFNFHMATRSTTAWTTDSIDAPQYNDRWLPVASTVRTSADLSHTVQISQRALTSDAVAGQGNLYLRDNATGARTLMATGSSLGLYTHFISNNYVEGTSDYDHVVFDAPAKLLPEAPSGQYNTYMWSRADGLELVSVLPDGSPAPDVGGIYGGANAMAETPISADGSRVLFKVQQTSALYLRDVEANTTTLVSRSHRAGDDPTRPESGVFVGLSRDGNQVDFAAYVPLVDGQDTPQIYRYTASSGELEGIMPGASADFWGGLKRAYWRGTDGRYYFQSDSKLTGDAQVGMANLYTEKDGQVALVGQLPDTELRTVKGWAGSPTGRYFAFASAASLTGYDNSSAACPEDSDANNPPGKCLEVFRYDAQTQDLECVSCTPGRRAAGHSLVGIARDSLSVGRWVNDQGHVFFETPNALVTGDSNAQPDVYEYDGTASSLISSGRSPEKSQFLDASVDGSSVFFTTSEALVGQDRDHAVDAYVARQGGGLAGQNPPDAAPECQGDDCQGTASPQPDASRPASVESGSKGNQRPTVRATFAIGALNAAQRANLARGKAVALRVRSTRAGSITVVGRAGAGDRTKQVVVGRGSARAGTSSSVSLRLTHAGRTALQRAGKLKLVLSVRVTGVARARTLSLTLQRPKAQHRGAGPSSARTAVVPATPNRIPGR